MKYAVLPNNDRCWSVINQGSGEVLMNFDEKENALDIALGLEFSALVKEVGVRCPLCAHKQAPNTLRNEFVCVSCKLKFSVDRQTFVNGCR